MVCATGSTDHLFMDWDPKAETRVHVVALDGSGVGAGWVGAGPGIKGAKAKKSAKVMDTARRRSSVGLKSPSPTAAGAQESTDRPGGNTQRRERKQMKQ